MAHAYTPGLRVTERTVLRKERRLPLKGEVVVKEGQEVKAEAIVAKTNLPGPVQTVNVAGILGILPEDVSESMLKKVGAPVAKNEAIAQSKGFFGLFKAQCKAPAAGTIENVSTITGQVILREPPLPVEIAAYIDGKVVEVIPQEGVVMETTAAFVQGIFGVGGETTGIIAMATDDPKSVLSPEMIKPEHKGKIVVGGAFVTSPSIARGIEVGAKAIVVGGIDDADLREFLGYDIGVAITGSEKKGITLVITEGFGKMAMAHRTFDLLKSKQGMKASVNGATQIRAGVMRPEVIVPLIGAGAVARPDGIDAVQGLTEGSPVRVIREPYFGKLGKVSALPPELQKLETESHARVLEVEFEDGKRAIVPRANVEMIEG
jgi:hypothetical protein